MKANCINCGNEWDIEDYKLCPHCFPKLSPRDWWIQEQLNNGATMDEIAQYLNENNKEMISIFNYMRLYQEYCKIK